MGQAGAAAISGAVLRPAGLSHRSQRLLLPWLLLLAVFTQAALPSSVPSNVCGNWQEKYTKLHRAILKREAPQRFVVALGSSGLADSLIGGVSVFYFALLSGRAFMWDHFRSPEHRVPLEWAYAAPNINWTSAFPDAVPLPDKQLLAPDAPDDGSGILRIRILNVLDNSGAEEYWSHKNLSTLGENFKRVEVNSNKGMTYQIFRNPYHAHQLYEMGLRPETAFGCIINYLLELKQEVRAHFAAVESQLRTPGVLRIGIQIRTGDSSMLQDRGHKLDLKAFAAYFDCAKEVEEGRGVGYPGGVLWYLITDSHALRAQARQLFGGRLLREPRRMEIGHFTLQTNTSLETIVQTSAAENWMFALTDVQIISEMSGFGRTAAFRSLRPQALYTVKPRPRMHWHKKFLGLGATPTHPRRKCGVGDFDDLATASQVWSRI